MTSWQFIESPPAEIFFHMALDRELFEEFAEDAQALPLLRIYKVSKPAATVGRSSAAVATKRYPEAAKQPKDLARQTTRRVRLWRKILRFAQHDGATYCVRPTGGGLVQHGNDLLYSVIARRDSFSTFGRVRTSYLSFHEAVQEALGKLGFETRLFRCDEARRNRHPEPFARHSEPRRGEESLAQGRLREGSMRSFGPLALRMTQGDRITECFKEPVATDVLFEEKKIAGGGQWRKREGFLHQGSIQLLAGISFEGMREALKDAFERKFDIVWGSNGRN